MKIRLSCVFFQGACDGNVKTSRIIARKSKNKEIWIFKKSDFQKSIKNRSEPSNIYSFSRRIRIRIQNWTKTSPKPAFSKNPREHKFVPPKVVHLHIDGESWKGEKSSLHWSIWFLYAASPLRSERRQFAGVVDLLERPHCSDKMTSSALERRAMTRAQAETHSEFGPPVCEYSMQVRRQPI